MRFENHISMKIYRLLSISLLILILGTTVSCHDKSRRQALADERQNWETSLKDSLVLFERQLDEAEKALPSLRNAVDSMLSEFTAVSNPREVEGYYIYSKARAGYPLTGTSITARLSKSEAPEIIAALKGGNFTAIRLLSNGSSIESPKVPYDQALNYRAGGLNTVAFTGSEVIKMLDFINSHAEDKIRIEYLNPEAVKSIMLSDNDRRALIATCRLVNARQKLQKTESLIPVISGKIQRLKERENSSDK